MNEHKRGLIYLHLAVMLFGFSAVIARFISVPSPVIAAGRALCSFLVLVVIVSLSKDNIRMRCKKDYILSVAVGAVLALHWTSFFQSIKTASVAIGTITFSTFPLFLIFLEPLVLKVKFQVKNIISVIIIIIGVLITVPEFSAGNNITVGIIWGMVSSFTYALMTLGNKYLSRFYDAKTICIYEQGAAALCLLPVFLFVDAEFTPINIAGILVIGVICTAFAHLFYVSAQKYVSAQTAGIVSGIETVYGIVYAMLLLGEFPRLSEVIGGSIILLVVIFSSLRKES